MTLDNQIFDSLSLERAKTWRELDYVKRNVEARMHVEGASREDWAAWEAELAKHAKRVAPAVLA
jgi:hypothetical protein